VSSDPPAVADRASIAAVGKRIQGYVRRTPVIEVGGADFGLDPSVKLTFKLELLQHTGSFKARGAFANLLSRDVSPVGVAAASGGNHGLAVAYAAARLGVRARIFVPSVASTAKTKRIRELGAELVIVGERYADALAATEEWIATSGALGVHAYDQRETILGQGTLGAELEQQAPSIESLLVAVGGGGLIAGVSTWYGDSGDSSMRVVGVEPEAAPTLTKALEAGRPVDAEAGGVASDSLAPRRVGDLVLPLVQRHVERVLLVSDEAIVRAQKALWSVLRVAAEPGGAAALAALLSGVYRPRPGEHVGVLVCGGNTPAVDFDSDTSAQGRIQLKEVVSTNRNAPPIGPFSPALRVERQVYLSGQVAQDPTTGRLIEGDVAAQTERILENVRALLETADKSLADVVRVGVFLTDMRDFAAMNEVYARYFETPFPVRTTVAVSALPLGALVEIEVMAG